MHPGYVADGAEHGSSDTNTLVSCYLQSLHPIRTIEAAGIFE